MSERISPQEFSRMQFDVQKKINAIATKQYGVRLAHRASEHICEAFEKSPGWSEALKFLQDRKKQSRSHNIALEMYVAFVAVLNAELIDHVGFPPRNEP